MKKITFDKNFLEQKIQEGEKILTQKGINKDLYEQVETMLINFYDYLNINHFAVSPEYAYPSIDKLIERLNNKLKRDLNKIDLENWINMKKVCQSVIPANIDYSYLNSMTSDKDVIDSVLLFYKQYDQQYYEKAKFIINHPYKLINFTSEPRLYDHCFACDYLNLPFINVNNRKEIINIRFPHELQHGIDYLLYKDSPFLFSETSAILTETLYIDYLSDNDVSNKKYYYSRIEQINNCLKKLDEYINILLKYIEHDFNINKENIGSIVDIKNDDDLRKKCNYFLTSDYIEKYKYILSFVCAINIRYIYYCNPTYAKNIIRNVMTDNDCEIDFDNSVKIYKKYINEIKLK